MTTPGLSDADREQLIADARARALAAQGPGARLLTPSEAVQQAATTPAAEDPGLDIGMQQIRAQQAAQGAAGPVTGAPMPAEDLQNQAMDEMRAQFEALVAQLTAQGKTIGALTAQLASLQAGVAAGQGDPLIVRYADAARDKLLTHAIVNPDLGGVHLAPVFDEVTSQTVLRHQATGHFQAALSDADKLAGLARQVAAGDAPAQAVLDTAGRVITFLERIHPRRSGKFLDFSAMSDDLTAVLEEAGKLLAAA